LTGSTVVPKLQTDLLSGQFVVADPLQVHSYLQAHPMLVLFLRNAYPIITRHFPPTQVTLAVRYDPEGGSGMLFGLVQTTQEAEETLWRLDELDNDPEWITLYTPVRSLCIISVE
jgi:hypothetical protein